MRTPHTVHFQVLDQAVLQGQSRLDFPVEDFLKTRQAPWLYPIRYSPQVSSVTAAAMFRTRTVGWSVMVLLLLEMAMVEVRSEIQDIPWWNIHNFLLNIANEGLLLRDMKERLSTLKYEEAHVDGKEVLQEKALQLTKLFAEHTKAVGDIRDAIQETLNETELIRADEVPDHLKCCSLVQLQNSTQNFHRGCATFSNDVIDGTLLRGADPTPRVLNTFRDIKKRFPAIRTMYYGLEEGIFYIFPLARLVSKASCKKYDHKIRYWYVLASSLLPKDIVILIDVDRGNSQLAEELVQRIMQSASPNDRVMVSLSEGEMQSALRTASNYDWTGSYAEHGVHTIGGVLMAGNEKNKKRILQHVVKTLHSRRRGYRGVASLFSFIEAGIEVLKNKMAPPLRIERSASNQLVLITDRRNVSSGEVPENLVELMQEHSNLNISLVSYLLDEAVESPVWEFLEKVSSLLPENLASTVVSLRNETDLNSSNTTQSFKSFHEVVGNLSKPLLPMPYWSYFGDEMIISFCLPLVLNQTFVGATCSDISLIGQLESVISIADMGESYAFLVDTYGRAFQHPLLPSPHSVHDHPTLVDITLLERDTRVQPLLDKMIKQVAGDEEVDVLHVQSVGRPRGADVPNGIRYFRKRFHYFWTPINNSDITLTVVLRMQDDGKLKSSRYECPNESTCATPHFQYHRLDTIDRGHLCRYFNGTVYRDHAVIKLAPTCFVDASVYLQPENSEWQTEVTQIFRGQVPGSRYKLLKPGLQKSVWLVEEAEEMLARAILHRGKVGIRYIGTYDGVISTFPGVQLQPKYDPRLRTWYQQAVANKADHPTVMVTTPYFDSIVSGMVVSVATPLQGPDNGVQAVLAADFTLQFMVKHFIKEIPICSSKYTCMLVDESGFVVLHTNFFKTTPCTSAEGKRANVTAAHISKLEPDIARDLISHGFLRRRGCVDYDRNVKYYFWKLQLNYGDKSFLSGNSSVPEYAIISIPYTALHLILAEPHAVLQHCRCSFSPEEMDQQECVDTCRSSCECPCIAGPRTQPCDQGLQEDVHRIHLPACTPTGPTDVVVKDTRRITEPCNDFSCSTRNEDECNQVVGCVWADRKCELTIEHCALISD